MRISVVPNDGLVKLAPQVTDFRTKEEAIEEGLKLLVDMHQQKRIKAFRSRLKWTK